MSIFRKFRRMNEQKEAKAYKKKLASEGKKVIRVMGKFGKTKLVIVDIPKPFVK